MQTINARKLPDLFFESLICEVQAHIQRLAKEKLDAHSVIVTDLSEESGGLRFERKGITLRLEPLNDEGGELSAQLVDEAGDYIEHRINTSSQLGFERSVSTVVNGIVQRLVVAGELSERRWNIFRDKSVSCKSLVQNRIKKNAYGILGEITLSGPLKLPKEFFAIEGYQLFGRVALSLRGNTVEVTSFEAVPPNPFAPRERYPLFESLSAGFKKLRLRLEELASSLEWHQALEQTYWETITQVTLPFESREGPEFKRSCLVWKALSLTRGIDQSEREWIHLISGECLEAMANEQSIQAATRRSFFQLLRVETAEPASRGEELERFNQVANELGLHRQQDPTAMYNPAFLYQKMVNQSDLEKDAAVQKLGMEFDWFLRSATFEQLVYLMKILPD